jgi:hypothetical protein
MFVKIFHINSLSEQMSESDSQTLKNPTYFLIQPIVDFKDREHTLEEIFEF